MVQKVLTIEGLPSFGEIGMIKEVKKQMITKKNIIIRVLLFFLISCTIFFLCQEMFVPKWDYPEQIENHSAKEKEYNRLKKDSVQVVFLGTSHVQYAVCPMEIYDRYQLVTYNNAISALRMSTAYYQLLKLLKKQNPSVVMLDVSSLYITSFYEYEWYYVLDTCYPICKDKVEACLQYAEEYYEASPKEQGDKESSIIRSVISHLFPLMAYHSRWKELGEADLIDGNSSYNAKGYVMSTRSTNVSSTIESLNVMAEDYLEEKKYKEIEYHNRDRTITSKPGDVYDYNIPKEQKDWLVRIANECRKHDIELVLFKVPVMDIVRNYASSWTKLRSSAVHKLAEEMKVPFYDLMYDTDIPIDTKTDYMDIGDHMNYSGALKVSDYLGRYLINEMGLDPQPDAYYEEGALEYKNLKETALLSMEYDWDLYIGKLMEYAYKYTVVISMKGTQFSLEAERSIIEGLNRLGLSVEDLNGIGEKSFIAVCEAGTDFIEVVSYLPIEKTISLKNGVSVNVLSMGRRNTAFMSEVASIKIQEEDYAVNDSGLNMVVIDNGTGLVIDSVCFSENNQQGMLECNRDSGNVSSYIHKYEHYLYQGLSE